MKRYVAGFLFGGGLEQYVVLVRKARPTWQAGMLNAVGGHIEDGEAPLEAMVREFKEEAGLTIKTWAHVVTLRGDGFEVWFYRAAVPKRPEVAGTMEEPVEWYNIPDLDWDAVIPNLRWLLPLASMPVGAEWPLLAIEGAGNTSPEYGG